MVSAYRRKTEILASCLSRSLKVIAQVRAVKKLRATMRNRRSLSKLRASETCSAGGLAGDLIGSCCDDQRRVDGESHAAADVSYIGLQLARTSDTGAFTGMSRRRGARAVLVRTPHSGAAELRQSAAPIN